MTGTLLAFFADEQEVDVSAHLDQVTDLSLWAIGLLLAFFLIRPELWRRLFFDRVDARPAALMRIAFGFVVLWTFVDLLMRHPPLEYSAARFLFTDEGLWLTDMARKNYSGKLKTLWDPQYGFEHWWQAFEVMWDRFSILHYRSDPPFVFGVYGVMMTSLVLMIFGVWTRWTTILAWFLVEMVYRYSPIWYTGGDTVTRVFLFLGMFARWGEAYSFDAWRRRRKAILSKNKALEGIPALRKIPAWPMRLMMLQLSIIYCATGLLKSGSTWADGTALYYSLNLDHFYRFPQTGVVAFTQFIGILPATTIVVRWWEVCFPLVLIGAAINAYERERRAGTWVSAALWRRALGWLAFGSAWAIGAWSAGLAASLYIPQKILPMPPEQIRQMFMAIVAAVPVVAIALYLGLRRFLPRVFDFVRYWLLGKRVWLVVGFGMHIGIDVGMNVGTFAEVMMAVYLAWLSGPEVEAFWGYVMSRPVAPGEAGRPIRKRKPLRVLLAPFDRLYYRAPGKRYTVHHHPDDDSIRRAALLRCWDLGHRLEFVANDDVPREHLQLRIEGKDSVLRGTNAAVALTKIFPGLWLLRPFAIVPGVSSAAGALALRVLRQRG